jgi:hypothetical protein
MAHPLLSSREFRGAALEALEELKLAPRADPLSDIVVETVLRCVPAGRTDPRTC